VATTDRGMARCVRDVFGSLVRRQRWKRLRLPQVYWYTWVSDYRGRSIFDFTGLRRYRRALPHPAGGQGLPRSARRHEGCAKTSTARCGPAR
jgi:hypothetical protein